MAMVGVALVLYGLIKFVSWTVSSSGRKRSRKKRIQIFVFVSNFLCFVCFPLFRLRRG